MSRAAKSVFAFGIYLIAVGVGMVSMPNTALGPLGFPPSTEVWPRVAGVVALVLAYYYLQAARRELTAFFHWTVHARAMVFVAFAALVLLGLAPKPLLALGAVDLLAAIWTGVALRSGSVP